LADLLKPEIIARLEAGLSCEIKPADHELLLAIFQQMAAARNLKLSDEVCEYVVSHLTSHARQLSGAINRLHATILTSNRPITRETVGYILEDMIRNNRRPVRLQDIEKAVCETMQLNSQLLQSKSRAKQATQPRMLALWLARKYTRSTLSEIGKYFGNRSHSTVVSSQKKVDQWLQESPDFNLADSSLSVAEVIHKVERLLQSY
jgi:chromosomal replication initiator protein